MYTRIAIYLLVEIVMVHGSMYVWFRINNFFPIPNLFSVKDKSFATLCNVWFWFTHEFVCCHILFFYVLLLTFCTDTEEYTQIYIYIIWNVHRQKLFQHLSTAYYPMIYVYCTSVSYTIIIQ